MDYKFKQSVAPIVLDKQCWDAFLALMDYEHKKIVAQLETNHPPDTLIRLNAQLCLIRSLKQTKETVDAIRSA